MRIAIGSDHAGYELKGHIRSLVEGLGHSVIDVGTDSMEPVDYPDYGIKVANMVSKGEVDRGILICGTGAGMCCVANKVKGIRAAVCTDVLSAIQAREHLDANILVLGGRITGKVTAKEIVEEWLKAAFEGGRHAKRLKKIKEWEETHILD